MMGTPELVTTLTVVAAWWAEVSAGGATLRTYTNTPSQQ